MIFVNIILPLPLPLMYTYGVPEEFACLDLIGKRVVVQFGKKKLYSALVRSIQQTKPAYETKDILAVLDQKPLLNEINLKFWEWIATYYLCTLGDVYKAALPAGLKIESETSIEISEPPDEEDQWIEKLSEKENKVIQALTNKSSLTIDEICKIIEQKSAFTIINSLFEKKYIHIAEKLKQNFKVKKEPFIKIHRSIANEEQLKPFFSSLSKSPKQLHLLMIFMQKYFDDIRTQTEQTTFSGFKIKKTDLLKFANSTSAALNSLEKKQILETEHKQISRIIGEKINTKAISNLNEHQQTAFIQTRELFLQQDVVLLHGVTSSGKTEVYIHLIMEYIRQKKRVLYLLPEIALTAQIINRLKSVFGNRVGIYHSKFSDNERVETWLNVSSGSTFNFETYDASKTDQLPPYDLVLGVRSSIFLPFTNLGLIIVDEEHENTYKQYDPAPRYHTRDAAIVLAKLHGAKVLLGTATPAVETYYNVQCGKYAKVDLTARYKDIQMPTIEVADVKDARKRKLMKSEFTPLLFNKMQFALQKKEQIILFQNRRGFSPFMECKTCGWVPQCEHCDVSLTYHKKHNHLLCHYCGYTIPVMGECFACGDSAMQTRGFGTEKIEDEIQLLFPDAKVGRLDVDTTRTRKAYEQIISDFENRQIDILIGTQMVSKGLDFENVSLVGVLNADNLLNFPDFRANERSFQLITQVSGRAGRSHERGTVVIQTTNPTHFVIKNILNNDFLSTFQNELEERQKYKYPPFVRIIELTLKHQNIQILDEAASLLGISLRSGLGASVLGPEYPLINRIQNRYLKTIMIKSEPNKSLAKIKEFIKIQISNIKQIAKFNQVIISIDVDPS